MSELKYTLNPFVIVGYGGRELFCDREKEVKVLLDNAQNGVNTTLISVRRMGKTGLIYHFFEHLNQEKTMESIFIDLYETQNLKEFTEKFASAIYQKFPKKKSLGEKFKNFIMGLSPVISYDALSGMPEIRFTFHDTAQCEQSLKSLFQFLEQQNVPIVIAFDEFQQIAAYPSKNTEAILRTIIQTLKNCRFIFSGSNRHVISEMFAGSKRPFFASTQFLALKPIEKEKYYSFIESIFKKYKKVINSESIEFILEWTRCHTYYTQMVCNHVFRKSGKGLITIEFVKWVCKGILEEQEMVFLQYRNLLTPVQWELLKAIAKEKEATALTRSSFLKQYHLTLSGSQRALSALINKEMVYAEHLKDATYYYVYDCFLNRWLERL
jgi:AAA+ ATPase superfamily predicted ATPase